ncbi:Fic family protein [Arthrobacter sp. E3]|uniref:Fic family protein n=1 Tax=Arthrobacter sp. E3 TaxID=517402 RepID=UPI0032B47323
MAIARFDERYGQHLAPFAPLLLRSESAASSRIENLTASARSLGEAELVSTEKANATLVVRNVRAMEAALASADEMNTASVLRMHEALMDGTPDEDVAGRWRQQQVWIGTSVVSPVGATFVPPKFERVPELMDDVMAYARRPDLPVMVQAAICHAQFETIHPFTDGNGRTGRALLHSMLKHRRVASRVTVPVSAGLLANVKGYHQALTLYREGDPDAIIEQCSEAAFLAIENGTTLAGDVSTITSSWREKITARSDAAVWKVLDLLARQPVVNAATIQGRLGLDYMRSKRAMDSLESAGIVVSVDKFKQGRFWRAPEMIEALDAFAERAGRRTKS